MREIPLEYLLLETDSPDQPPQALQGQLNPLSSLLMVAAEVARLRNKTPVEILEISTNNFKRLFPKI